MDLRKRAEAHHGRRRKATSPSPDQVGALVHALEVHQIELELQNEELRAAQLRLEESLARYRDLFDLAPVGYLTLTPNGVIVNANLTVAALLGIARDRLSGTKLQSLVSRKDQDGLFGHLRSTFHGMGRKTCELELVRGDNDTFVAQVESVAEDAHDESSRHCLTVVTDITERRRHEALILRQANYDPLTDLPNRTLFRDRLAYTIRTAQRQRTSLALFYIDLDNFKWVNDTYGHFAGDRVLIECAGRLTRCARENDTVARLSGDEFCMLLPLVATPADARLVAGKVVAAMEPLFKLDDGSSLHVSCSVGVAMYPEHCDSAEALMQGADAALFQVKRSGRGQVAFFAKELNEKILRQQMLGLELKQAVSRGELSLRYQPLVNLATGKSVDAEVLVRWQHPEQGLLLPSEFIPIAETNGVIVELGEWVLNEVYQQANAWHETGLALNKLWVNLSAKQCGNVNRTRRLTALLKRLNTWKGMPCVGLEITESHVLHLSEQEISAFAALHQDGTSVAIDDFGTGFSSLTRLLHLPFDAIKIDGAFIADIASSHKVANLVKAMIALGHSMDARVVAEGIETHRQVEILRDLGCDFGQGFYFSDPMKANDIVDFVGRR